MNESDVQAAEPVRPHLWNPNAAANWSILLTPAFGAYLHAANWRALGKPEHAANNMMWLWVTVAFLVVNIGTLFVPESKAIDAVMRYSGLSLLVGWYFTQGRSQARFVKESLGDNYIKKGWAQPLAAGVTAIVAYLAVVFFIAIAVYKPDPKELAAEVKPLILQEWQKSPEFRGATIQDVTLVHKGGNTYTGFVDATLAGKNERLKLEITHDGQTFLWQIKSADN